LTCEGDIALPLNVTPVGAVWSGVVAVAAFDCAERLLVGVALSKAWTVYEYAVKPANPVSEYVVTVGPKVTSGVVLPFLKTL
jgi:hypothetical protein